MLHGKTGFATEGCRLYMKVRAIEDDGEKWNAVREEIRGRIGKAADMLKNLVWFEIVEARPILDFGQGI
jgi:flavin-binding protein dodecin